MTKYEEIARTIRDRITSGTYPPNTLLPNQTDFVEEFSVSRMTVKKALNLLIKEGLINSQRGAGTKVMSPSLWGFISDAPDKYELEKLQIPEEQQNSLACEIISFEVNFPNENVQQQLLISQEQPVYSVQRLYRLAEQPYVLEELAIPVFLVPGLTKEVLLSSIYDHLTQKLHLSFAGTFKNIYADQQQENDQRYLKASENEPILVTEQIAYLKDGQPVEFSVCRSLRNQRVISVVNVKNV